MSVTDKLISLSETALLITELQLGEYLIEFTDVDISEVSLKVATTYVAAMKEKDIQLIANFDENAKIIHGDDELIRNSVNKILQNAIKFTPKYGLIQIQSTKNDLFVELIVTNSGDGFSAETLEKLFEIFAIDKMTNFSDGFGLGLASVKLAMEVQSGRIEVKNHSEGGASVTLMFPA
jgi:K+-sensing histidine kinase KdpD